MPWARWQRQAFGALGWSPREFWSATPFELWAAIDGWLEARGVDPDAESKKPEHMTREELADLMQRFPDGGSIKGRPTARTIRVGRK